MDHVWNSEKGNVEEEGDHFLRSMAKEEEKGRLKYWESLVGENHVVLHNTKNIWRMKVKDFECVFKFLKGLYFNFLDV